MNVPIDSHEYEVVYLVYLAGAYAFFVYVLFRSVKAGRGRKGFLAPIILLTCSAAFGVPTVIRTLSCDSFTKFEYVSFTVAETLVLLAVCIYGPGLALTLRPAKAAESPGLYKIWKVIIAAGGIAVAVWVVFDIVWILRNF
ncbi:MAG: hypothetical protein ACYS4W_01465 [Planctomycetota bacterium]